MIITDEQREERFLSNYQRVQKEMEEMFEEEETPKIIEPEDKKTLTTILAELDRLDAYCDDSQEFESSLNELRSKVESIIQVLRGMDKRIKDIDWEISNLQRVKKIVDNKRKNLEDYLKHNLSNAKFNEVITDNFKLTLKPSTALVIDDANLNWNSPLVKSYLVEKTMMSFDKNKIKEEIKNETLPKELEPYFYISSEKILNFRWRT